MGLGVYRATICNVAQLSTIVLERIVFMIMVYKGQTNPRTISTNAMCGVNDRPELSAVRPEWQLIPCTISRWLGLPTYKPGAAPHEGHSAVGYRQA